jgi:hypothetical protein
MLHHNIVAGPVEAEGLVIGHAKTWADRYGMSLNHMYSFLSKNTILEGRKIV